MIVHAHGDNFEKLEMVKKFKNCIGTTETKSFVGKLLKKDNPKDRLFGSVVAEAIAVLNGADIVRTHNVLETKQAVEIAQSLAQKKPRKAYNTS